MWKDIPWTNGAYSVNDQGYIRSNDRISKSGNRIKGRILKSNDNGCGYQTVNLVVDGKRYSKLVHRLVAEAFCEGYSEGLQVDHLNHDKSDNRYTNLEWVTCSENIKRAYRDGLNYQTEKRKEINKERAKKNRRELGKPIAKIDPNTYKTIETYPSLSYMHSVTGYWLSNVKRAAENDTISYGFRWRFLVKM